MSEGGEKRYDASQRKLGRLREEGQVWHSRDATAVVSATAAIAALIALAPQSLARTRDFAVERFASAAADVDAESAFATSLHSGLDLVLRLGIPALAAAALAGCLASLVQVGPLWSTKKFEPKWDSFDPTKNLKRTWFSLEPWFEFGKGLLRLVLIGLLAYDAVREAAPDLLAARGFEEGARVLAPLAGTLAIRALLVMGAFATADLIFQRLRFLQRNKMDHEELKRESKEDGGSPEVRQRRAQARHEILQRPMAERLVEEADVLVVNPTHVACALRYDPARDGAPRVVAKGMGEQAAELRRLAREQGIPIRRKIPLARALYRLELEGEIPPALFAAVLEVLRWVQEREARRGRRPSWL